MKVMMTLLVSVVLISAVDASGGRRWRGNWSNSSGGNGWTSVEATGSATPLEAPKLDPSVKQSKDALDEVNAVRAQRGLKAYVNDPLLNKAAQTAAALRAQSHNAGHLPSDFACLPQGGQATSAGCAAWEPSFGWGACCTYDSYTYAGAAWVMGSDGRRYMHLFVR